MKRVTVCWEDEARDDLAALWSAASDRSKLSRGVAQPLQPAFRWHKSKDTVLTFRQERSVTE